MLKKYFYAPMLALVMLMTQILAFTQSPVCRRNCAFGDAGCAALEAACQTKLTLYQGYMAQLDSGVTLHQLPEHYITALRASYPSVNLHNWRFGYGNHQPPNNATTDCSKTYFNNSSYVTKLKNGNLSTSQEFHWMLHEIQHFVQCNRVGGRDAYAKMWFDQLSVTFVQNSDLATLHDRMPMEAEADRVADQALQDLADNRDSTGKIINPEVPSQTFAFGLQLKRNNQVIAPQTTLQVEMNTSHTLIAEVSGSTGPFEYQWKMKSPGATTFSTVAGSGTDGRNFSFSPFRTGLFEIKCKAFKPSTQQSSNEVIVKFNVAQAQLPDDLISAVTPLPQGLRAKLTVSVSRSTSAGTPPASICIIDGETQATYWQAFIYDASATFDVPAGKTLKVVARASGFRGESLTVPQLAFKEIRNVSLALSAGSGGPACAVQ